MAKFTVSASKTDHMLPFTNMYKHFPFVFSSTQVTTSYAKMHVTFLKFLKDKLVKMSKMSVNYIVLAFTK